MPLRIPVATQNAMADAAVDLLDAGAGAGVLEIRTGSQPATANDAATGTLLATVTLGDPAFGDAASGTATGADPAAVTGVAAGDAGWFRAKDSSGATVFDGDVTVTGSGGVLQLATVTISVGLTVDITALSITQPGA